MDRLLKKMQTNGVLIDTNLLILLIVGLVDVSLIKTHKKLSAYSSEDFVLLVAILETCRYIVASPHILAETSNLAGRGLYDELETKVYAALKGLLSNNKFIETHVNAIDITNNDGYFTYGLSDIGLLESLNENYVLLTDDYRLSGYANDKGFEVLNFMHLKYGIFESLK